MKDLAFLPILNWFDVGVALELEASELKVIKKNFSGDLKRQRNEMFQLWLNNEEVTIDTLVKALLDTDNIEAALKYYHTKGITIIVIKA